MSLAQTAADFNPEDGGKGRGVAQVPSPAKGPSTDDAAPNPLGFLESTGGRTGRDDAATWLLRFKPNSGGDNAFERAIEPVSAPTVTSVRVYKVASFRGTDKVCDETVSSSNSETRLKHYGDHVVVTVLETGYINTNTAQAFLDGNIMEAFKSDPISPGRGQAADRFTRMFINKDDDISYGPVDRIFTYKAQDNTGSDVTLKQPFTIHWAYMQK